MAGSNDFKPIPITKGVQRDKDIDTMAHRVVQTYVAANPVEHRQGETFYTREAHGTARALAAGFDPDSDMGRLLRTMPSPGEVGQRREGVLCPGLGHPRRADAEPLGVADELRVFRSGHMSRNPDLHVFIFTPTSVLS